MASRDKHNYKVSTTGGVKKHQICGSHSRSTSIKTRARSLAAEAVQGAALAFEGVDNIHSGNGLSPSMLGIGYSVADHVLEKNLENSPGLLVDKTGDTLHTSAASQATDRWLRDSLDVVAKHLTVALSATLAKSLASLPASRHDTCSGNNRRVVLNFVG